MAKYNYSKSEAKKLGVARVQIGGSSSNVKKANKFQDRHGYNKGQYENDLRGQGVDLTALRSAGRQWGNNMNPGESRRELAFIAEARKKDKYAFYNPEVRRTGTAYDEAKERYTGMLDSMKPRYADFYNQLEREEGLAKDRDAQLQGKEETNLRKSLASRGLDATNTGAQYGGDRNKLQDIQNTRAEGISLDFNRERLNTRQMESNEESMINQLISNTDTDRSAAINNIIHGDRAFFAGRNDVEEAKRQFNLNFALTQDEGMANRAAQMYQFTMTHNLEKAKFEEAKRKSGKGTSTAAKYSKEYISKLSSLQSQALAGTWGTQDGIRENFREQLFGQFGTKMGKTREQIQSDIEDMMPNGWESYVIKEAGGSYPSEQEINSGLAQMGNASDEQRAQFIRANGGNPTKYGY